MSDIDKNSRDHLVSVAKGVVGACPLIGPLASEAISTLIPNQRLDRVAEFLQQLEKNVRELDARLDHFEMNVKSQEGLSIMESGLVQASRAASKERKKRLANLVAHSLTQKEIKFEESRKLLNLFRELTDPELLWLIFYSLDPVLGSGPHKDLVEKHPEVLRPISREMGAPQEQVDRAALQNSYKNTLRRYGLIKQKGNTHRITSIGRLLVRYIEEHEAGMNES